MHSTIRFRLAALIVFAMPALGCATVGEPRPGSFAYLTDSVAEKVSGRQPEFVASQPEATDELTLTSLARTGDATGAKATRPAIQHLKRGESLDEIVRESSGVVLLDFHATWCGPCKKQSQVLKGVEDFASEVDARIIKVDIDQHKDLARDYGVSSMPTLVAIKKGKVLKKRVGLTGTDQVKSMLQ